MSTIHVKQQHNVDFLIFNFSLKCSLTEKTVWEVYFKYTLIMLHLHFLIKEVSNNFFNQWILFSYIATAKETLKIFHPLPHYKTNPPPLPSFPPISSKNFPSPHYSHFWKISSPSLWRGRGVGGVGLWNSIDKHTSLKKRTKI